MSNCFFLVDTLYYILTIFFVDLHKAFFSAVTFFMKMFKFREYGDDVLSGTHFCRNIAIRCTNSIICQAYGKGVVIVVNSFPLNQTILSRK